MTVFTLIDKEARLLPLKPVNMEVESVLHSYVAAHRSVDKSVLMLDVSFKRQCGFTLVVDIGYFATSNFNKRLTNLITIDMHSYRMGLHHSSVTITIDNQSRQIVTLAMYQSECVVVLTSN